MTVAATAMILSGCGQSPPAGAAAPGTSAAQPDGATVRIANSMDVINARIPAPAPGSRTAQLEVTMADTGTAGPDTLLAATSPAARAITFTRRGQAAPEYGIPIAAGSSVSAGPPHRELILLTGLTRRLQVGQAVAVSLLFARAGHATLQVPVVEPTP
jgi:copper(I)-binding protein